MTAGEHRLQLGIASGLLAVLWFLGCMVCGPSARASTEFAIESVAAEESTSEAGWHPDFATKVVFSHHENSEGRPEANARVQEVTVALPPGLVGRPTIAPRCSTGQFLLSNCPTDSQVGVVDVLLSGSPEEEYLTEPVYNLEPPHDDEIARFGFIALLYPVYIDVAVRTASDYGVTGVVRNPSGQVPIIWAKTIFWGTPADSSHDSERLTPEEARPPLACHTACTAPGGERPSGLSPHPFMSNPTACENQEVLFQATSYQLPGQVFTRQTSLPPTTGCGALSFQPSLQVEPTSRRAGAPTGLSAVLKIPQTDAVNLPATSAMRAAKITLPEGMTVSSSAADGLEACSAQQVALGEEVQSECPDGSKLGSTTFRSPALPEALHGSIYQATPEPGHLFRVWLVTDEFGLHVKLPGEIVADPRTGQLTAEFAETPQLPIEEVDLEFKGGPKAPLKNPDACGTYLTSFELTPWSGNPAFGGQSQMTLDEGCGGGAFSPKLEAGVTNPVAGSYSPLVVRVRREDGEDRVAGLELKMPKGELAKLKGVPLCSNGEASSGNCPADSQVGSVTIAVGVGPQPLWLPQPGKAPTGAYLAGPYKGAAYSLVTVIPAQAGPFDLGTVSVRSGLYIDPDTAQVTVKTDALPQILEGVPVLYRTLHVAIDRPKFTLNPTSCREMPVIAKVASATGAIATPADRFQVGECATLGFRPRLRLTLNGGTRRGAHPALRATLTAGKGQSNIRKVAVALPHSEFLAQEHIDTICTRIRFAADNCPAGSIYGHAWALSPLLGQPLEGPVYLRSSSNPLPDLVVALHGPININLTARIDSINGGIRTTFGAVPDAPVTKFVLRMKGGRKSLLVNSTDTCRVPGRVDVEMVGQNGRHRTLRPRLKRRCRR